MTPEFTLRTAELASAAPQQWAQFLKEFEDYSAGLTRALLSATTQDFPRLQGRAVHAAQLLEHFQTARNKARTLSS